MLPGGKFDGVTAIHADHGHRGFGIWNGGSSALRAAEPRYRFKTTMHNASERLNRDEQAKVIHTHAGLDPTSGYLGHGTAHQFRTGFRDDTVLKNRLFAEEVARTLKQVDSWHANAEGPFQAVRNIEHVQRFRIQIDEEA